MLFSPHSVLLCYYVKTVGYLVYEACEVVYTTCYYALVYTVFYYVKRICHYVKVWVILSKSNLARRHVIMSNSRVVLSTQCRMRLISGTTPRS